MLYLVITIRFKAAFITEIRENIMPLLCGSNLLFVFVYKLAATRTDIILSAAEMVIWNSSFVCLLIYLISRLHYSIKTKSDFDEMSK